MVRIDGGGCGLGALRHADAARSGMLAIPGLIELVEDRSLRAASTSPTATRALREITDAGLPDDPRLWREWFSAHGAETTDRFRRFEDGQDRRR